jgi:gluconate 2-dehydrogenase gamma chain
MNRRTLLQILALAASGVLHAKPAASKLDEGQQKLLAELAELILPRTDTPGAIDAGVPAFIDVMFAEWAGDDERKMFTAGLADVDARARAMFAKDFIACTPEQQTQLLTTLDAELARLRDTKADTSKSFLAGMKWLTLTGYYTSEVGATSELHYRVVPGRYEPCYPLDQ